MTPPLGVTSGSLGILGPKTITDLAFFPGFLNQFLDVGLDDIGNLQYYLLAFINALLAPGGEGGLGRADRIIYANRLSMR